MAIVWKNKRGKDVTLLNLQEKRDKFLEELKTGKRFTNNSELKIDDKGNPLKLSEKGRAYRAGYLAAQNESAKAFKKKNPNYVRKGQRGTIRMSNDFEE